jgi:hypothetical protein
VKTREPDHTFCAHKIERTKRDGNDSKLNWNKNLGFIELTPSSNASNLAKDGSTFHLEFKIDESEEKNTH